MMIRKEDLYDLMPASWEERTRLIGRDRVACDGEFVLYWMRAAIRAEENQALDVAILLANRLELPLLVYQGLSDRYPFASDRHHTFILQGARDVQVALGEKSITYALHVERPDNRGPHLRSLASRAAAVVTEDMPTEPLRSWTVQLSRGLECGIVVVDTACVVPMRLVGKGYDRAFAFRNATKKLYAERISLDRAGPERQTSCETSIDLPFYPVDLRVEDVTSLVSQCEIDHSIAAVPHTPGGSLAGYRRWNEFREKGLATYDRRRNNPLIDGVSRMSAYLHYGMVAPTRIAREAAAENSRGAEKLLDELLIWRELAYVFCHYHRNHGRVTALPQWARETLHEHENDARELLSWEVMARGRTGDSIWDSAQRSLLIHGELHNNVRMTWGKAVLRWTSDAKHALRRMIDLNHRYALDGRDPASYGGILWCLGQFDRPFSPPQPVFGTVRTRTTHQHAERLDPDAYRRKVTRSLWNPIPSVAVIGAGISGLICARTLADHGCNVTIFEKSRGVSGRMSTRRLDHGMSFDHGAQYFTARDERFKRCIHSWMHDGLVQPWRGRIVVIEDGIVTADKSSADRFVAVPGMSSIGKHIATDLNIRLQTQVTHVERSNKGWSIAADEGIQLGEFNAVVAAIPSHQAASLLSESPDLAERARETKMNGCWALMLAFEQTLGLGFDGAFVHQSPLSWIARNSSKTGCDAQRETWVAHASADWTEANMESTEQEVTRLMLDAFFKAVSRPAADPIYADAHRWRFAIPPQPLTENCLFDEDRMIGASGDWCGGPRVEGAFLSGTAIAGRLLGKLNTTLQSPTEGDKQLSLF